MIYCNKSNQAHYPFQLPTLPFDKSSFMPHFTSETFDYHHGKHHQAYVTNLNNLLKDNIELTSKTLEEIIIYSRDSNQSIFNNAAQIWNHSFFWHSIIANGTNKPYGKLLAQINNDFGNIEHFNAEFLKIALSQFGSGWTWLVLSDQKLQIIKTQNAETPITEHNLYPILCCDVWEHAYYIDYRNNRTDYVKTIIDHLINWDFAEDNFNSKKE
jgi:Fe-Mn family superoxide dismutase